jgi:hypothetical protein
MIAGRTNVHDEKQSGRTSVVIDVLVQSISQQFSERLRFIFSELLRHFTQISRTLLYEILRSKAVLSQVLPNMGSEKSSRVHTKRREWLQLDFGAISQRWR